MMVLPVDVPVGVGPRMSARVLARMATTGIYLVRGVPLGLSGPQGPARREGTSRASLLAENLLHRVRVHPANQLCVPAR